MLLQDVKFVFEADDDVLLTLELGLVVALQSSNAHLQGFLSSLELRNLLPQAVEVTVVQLVRLDFSSVRCHDSLSESL